MPTNVKTKKAKLTAVRQGRRVVNINEIKNKIKRREVWGRRKTEMTRIKRRAYLKRRTLRKKHGFAAAPYKIHTQETKRVPDETIVEGFDEEIEGDHAMDEFAPHFSGITKPKICITTSIRPLKKTLVFINELLDSFPDAKYFTRRKFTIKGIIQQCIKRQFTSLIVVHDDKNNRGERGFCRGPHKLLHVSLPNGPTAFYRLTSIRTRNQIYRGSVSTGHRPELIMSNFSTRLGVRLGRMCASLFDQRAEFRGRQVVTLRNQRDFVFFRRHRYVFTDEGQDCELQELGPRFTLKLIYLHEGLFDPKYAQYEWKWHEDMGTQRLKWHL
eukprot:CAMPEP_0197036470 /NCGR_PEP_ID=MMETSP1384-20130603/13963_1 /TAXON_ID=29189 /ORGANISM="Ammonia sp." /LENGTH=326 /DNA_ID=CAMNT_0042466651 /DNA_START=33 /DNA_END=1013 /DNA_ORIENTATION=+